MTTPLFKGAFFLRLVPLLLTAVFADILIAFSQEPSSQQSDALQSIEELVEEGLNGVIANVRSGRYTEVGQVRSAFIDIQNAAIDVCEQQTGLIYGQADLSIPGTPGARVVLAQSANDAARYLLSPGSAQSISEAGNIFNLVTRDLVEECRTVILQPNNFRYTNFAPPKNQAASEREGRATQLPDFVYEESPTQLCDVDFDELRALIELNNDAYAKAVIHYHTLLTRHVNPPSEIELNDAQNLLSIARDDLFGSIHNYNEKYEQACRAKTGISFAVADVFGPAGRRIIAAPGLKFQVFDLDGALVSEAETGNSTAPVFLKLQAGEYTLQLDIGAYLPSHSEACEGVYSKSFELRNGETKSFTATVLMSNVADDGQSAGNPEDEDCIREKR
ncbi:MAG: hypothetical protein AAGL90_17455 [Pseudomonadota bacterium]